MVYPIRTPSNEAVQNAVFDYLNLNRHKFDRNGNFDLTPDVRDYVPLQLVRYRVRPPKRTGEFDYLIQPRRRKLTTMTEEDERRRELHDKMAENGELTPEKCREEWEKEIDRCDERWTGRNYTACKQRAADRLRDCRSNRRYLTKEWGWEDLDMPEIEKEEFRKRFGKPDAQKYEEGSAPDAHDAPGLAGSETQERDLSAWAKSQLEQFAPPPPESSMEYDPFGQQPLIPVTPWRRIQRGIRATPGMGYMGGLGGGAKPQLFPRYPGDPRVPQKLY